MLENTAKKKKTKTIAEHLVATGINIQFITTTTTFGNGKTIKNRKQKVLKQYFKDKQ